MRFISNFLARVITLNVLRLCVWLSLVCSISHVHAQGHYELTLSELTVAATRSTGEAWDTGFGRLRLPDLYVSISLHGRLILSAKVSQNSIYATPNIKSESFDLKRSSQLEIIVFDKDLSEDDYIGKIQEYISSEDEGNLSYRESLIRKVNLTLSLTDAGRAWRAQQQIKKQQEFLRQSQQKSEERVTREIQLRKKAEAQASLERGLRQRAEQLQTFVEEQARSKVQRVQKIQEAQSLFDALKNAIHQQKRADYLELWSVENKKEGKKEGKDDQAKPHPEISLYQRLTQQRFQIELNQLQERHDRALLTVNIFAHRKRIRDEFFFYAQRISGEWKFVSLDQSLEHAQSFLGSED